MRYTIFIAASLLLLLSSCGKMKDPVFNNIDSIKVGKLGIGQTTVTLGVQYFNPNDKRAKLKKADGEVWLDSSFLGHFHVDTLVDIPANSAFSVPVKLDVDMKYFLKYVSSGFQSDQDVLVTIKGKMRAGRGGFFKNFPINYEGKQNLSKLFSNKSLLGFPGK